MKWKNFMHTLYGRQAVWLVLSPLLLGATMVAAEPDTPLQKMRQTLDAQGNATVRIEIADPRDPTSNEEVAYRLQQQNGDWYVHDLLIEGASMVSNFRTKFDRIIPYSQNIRTHEFTRGYEPVHSLPSTCLLSWFCA